MRHPIGNIKLFLLSDIEHIKHCCIYEKIDIESKDWTDKYNWMLDDSFRFKYIFNQKLISPRNLSHLYLHSL